MSGVFQRVLSPSSWVFVADGMEASDSSGHGLLVAPCASSWATMPAITCAMHMSTLRGRKPWTSASKNGPMTLGSPLFGSVWCMEGCTRIVQITRRATSSAVTIEVRHRNGRGMTSTSGYGCATAASRYRCIQVRAGRRSSAKSVGRRSLPQSGVSRSVVIA